MVVGDSNYTMRGECETCGVKHITLYPTGGLGDSKIGLKVCERCFHKIENKKRKN